MSTSERRAVGIVVVSLAANAALDLSGYENDWLAIALWIGVVVGIAYLFWPKIAERAADRFRGEKGWRAAAPVWGRDIGRRVLLRLYAPDRADVDETVECAVEGPDRFSGGRPDVRLPGADSVNGVPNDFYFAVFADYGFAPEWPGWTGSRREPEPLMAGPYRVSWYSTKGTAGRKLLAVRWFTVRRDGTVR